MCSWKSEVSLKINQNQSCSRVHAALVHHKHLNRAFLVDLGSTHGTYIGSVRLEGHKPTPLPMDRYAYILHGFLQSFAQVVHSNFFHQHVVQIVHPETISVYSISGPRRGTT